MEFFLGAFTAEWEQRRAAFLHDLSLGRMNSTDEEERRRRGGVAGIADGGKGAKFPGFNFRRTGAGKIGEAAGRRRADRPMRSRFGGLASGSQPAVVKMASFGGGGRLGAMVNYISRNGDVAVENERGDVMRGRDQLSAVGGEWDHLMKNRAESRDIGLFQVAVADHYQPGSDIYERAREVVKRGFGDRAFAFAVTERTDGRGFQIEGLVVLRSSGGERLTADDKAAEFAQKRYDAGDDERVRAEFRFTGYGNGTDYGTSRLRSLVNQHSGSVQDEKGRVIADEKRAGDLVQLEWRDTLHSRKPRDVMHLILSARAGTDAEAFHAAARDFLATEFAGHRYVFSVHDAARDPKAEEAGGKRPHVHVHAIVAMRSDAGDRIETTIAAFRHWRLAMAEKARAHGINMEMTDRRERASPAAYTKNQVRPLNTIGRTEHEGTSVTAQRRYDAKRADERAFAHTARSATYSAVAQTEWRNLAISQENQAARGYAQAQIDRLVARTTPAALQAPEHGGHENSSSQFRTHLVKLLGLVSEADDMRHMTRPEFEAYEKRVETALFQAERTMPASERADFEEIASAAREHVNVRRELVELNEQRSTADISGRDVDHRVSNDRKDAEQRWNDAVARYGFAAADAANKILVEIEQSRETMDRAGEAEPRPEAIRALKQELDSELMKAAELGVAGNGLIREVAEFDDELRMVLQAVEREREKTEKEKIDARSEISDADRPEKRGTPSGELMQTIGVEGRIANQREAGGRGDVSGRNEGDTTKSDPAQQHVPRLEELQREADERKERDRDERER